MRLAGIQPGWIPWLGYFDQMARVDHFLVADEMPFARSGWTQRNRVAGPNGVIWLRLPTRAKAGQRICDVSIDVRVPWRAKTLRTLQQAYARSPHAPEEIERLAAVLDQGQDKLTGITIPVIEHLRRRLGITTPVTVSSEIGLDAKATRYMAAHPASDDATGRIITYLHLLGADSLLEGESGRDFLDVDRCAAAGIDVEFHQYQHPRYEQLHLPFTSHLSACDLLLTHGSDHAQSVLHSAATA